jgi:hypothetical protein
MGDFDTATRCADRIIEAAPKRTLENIAPPPRITIVGNMPKIFVVK